MIIAGLQAVGFCYFALYSLRCFSMPKPNQKVVLATNRQPVNNSEHHNFVTCKTVELASQNILNKDNFIFLQDHDRNKWIKALSVHLYYKAFY
jgi:hypothetical protein